MTISDPRHGGTQPTIDERCDIWRLAYSRSSLLQAKGIADVLLAVQPRITHDHRIGLITGLVVTYARPFTAAQLTKSRRLIPLYDIAIPREHRELHDTYMAMRHQVFGHKDATGPTTDDGVLNQIRFVLKDGYLNLHTVTPGYYDHGKLSETRLLCDKLVSDLDDKLATLIERHPMSIADPKGTFVMNIENPDRPWIVRVHE